jgi:23S rRNA pseudouridine2605 synthase
VKPQRLAKALAEAGIASRRACETIIQDGRVTVNGRKVVLPEHHIDWQQDIVAVDGQKLAGVEPKVYFAVHKPRGFVCSSDPKYAGRRAIDLVEGSLQRLYTAGRLDRDTSGLLIITNDGHFAHRLMHPSFEISKEYLVKVDKEVLPNHLFAISAGTRIEGKHVKPLRVCKVRKNTLKVVVAEGKKHEVRYLVGNQGLAILELKRIRIGHIVLGTLAPGQHRFIGELERIQLSS